MFGITPTFDVLIGGTSLLPHLTGRATAITVQDAAGSESDTAEIEIDAGARDIELPRKGAMLSVSLGYAESGLVSLGTYTVDEVHVASPPLKITIAAKSADMRASLKEQRTTFYEATTMGGIVAQVAGRHGLEAAVHSSLSSRNIAYVAQTEESDINFLSRLARLQGAIVAPKAGKLVFVPRGRGFAASGSVLPIITLNPDDCLSFDVQLPDRPQVAEVKAHWHDRKTATRKEETAKAGDSGGSFALRHAHATQDEAKSAAEAMAGRLKSASGSLSISMPGTPSIAAGSIINTRGFYPGADYSWTVSQATHTLDASSFTTSLTCELIP